MARPLARVGVSPNAVTLAGLAVAVGAAVVAQRGWVAAACALVVLSGVLDNLDGAVALLTGRATRHGFVLDSVCDRLADAAYCAALWFAGAPGPLVLAGGAVAWLHEYTRARAAVAGMPEVGVVTVAERPTRVVVTAMFLLGAGLYPGSTRTWATTGACAWVAVGVVGAAQLAVTVNRRLR